MIFIKAGSPDLLSPCALGHQIFLNTKDLRINILFSKECAMEDRFLMYWHFVFNFRSNYFIELTMRAFLKLYLFFISELSYVVYIVKEKVDFTCAAYYRI